MTGPMFKHWSDMKGKPVPEPTGDLRTSFLEHLERTGDVVTAAACVDVEQGVAWSWRQKDEAFAAAWDKIVRERLLPILEAEAVRRAVRTSDALLMFMLKSYNRDRYDDAFARLKAAPSAPRIKLTVTDVDGSDLGSLDLGAAREELADAAVRDGTVREDDLVQPDD